MSRPLLAFSLLLLACDTETQACTAIGCVDGLQIAFQAASWPAGKWQVTAQTPTGARTCTVTLPFASVDPGVQCDAQVQLGTSGSALPAANHSLVGLTLPDTPTQVTVTVSRDGQQLASQVFSPTYKTSRPNGPKCDPECTQASATLSW